MSNALAVWRLTPLRLDTVVYPDWHPRRGDAGPVYAYLLQSAAGAVLVDTGIGPSHPAIDRLYTPARRDLERALDEEAGISVTDIDAVLLTHLHFDHVGGAHRLPGVPLHVQRGEWDAAQAANYTVSEFLTFEGANFVLHDGDFQLFSGVTAILTADHTPGHQAVIVATAAGNVALAGQAIETSAELMQMEASESLSTGAASLLAHNPSAIWFSHDDAHWTPSP